MKKKKISLLVTFAAALLFSVCASIFVNNVGAQEAYGEPVLVGGEIEEEYILGEYLVIPSAQITCGGETMDAKTIVRQPGDDLCSEWPGAQPGAGQARPSVQPAQRPGCRPACPQPVPRAGHGRHTAWSPPLSAGLISHPGQK